MPSSDIAAICDALRQFDPLTGLDDLALGLVARDVQILEATRGRRLLEIGCEDDRQLFLLDGELELTADDGASHRVRAHDPAARGPISRLRPSRYQITARTDVRYVMIDQAVLDASTSDVLGMVVEESVSLSEPNELLDDSASHPLIYDVFNDVNLGRIIVPSGSDIAIRIGRSLHRHEKDIGAFVDALMLCPSLTLKTLRAARAGRRSVSQIRSTRDAVARLGIEKAYVLSVNCILRETLRTDSPIAAQRMDAWWERSLRVAAGCTVLARTSERFDPEFAYLIGLLHGIAEPVMLGYADRHPDLSEPAALDNVLSANSAELGRILLSMWNMPGELVEATARSRHWGYDHGGDADYSDILLVARWHASLGETSRPRIPPIEDISAFARLGISATTPELHEKIAEAEDNAIERVDQTLAR